MLGPDESTTGGANVFNMLSLALTYMQGFMDASAFSYHH